MRLYDFLASGNGCRVRLLVAGQPRHVPIDPARADLPWRGAVTGGRWGRPRVFSPSLVRQ